jgi:hypothetical protein
MQASEAEGRGVELKGRSKEEEEEVRLLAWYGAAQLRALLSARIITLAKDA